MLIDAARQHGWPEAEDPRVLRSILLTSARKLKGWTPGRHSRDDDEYCPLDFHQGAGLVHAADALDLLDYPLASASADSSGFWDYSTISCVPDDPNRMVRYDIASPAQPGRAVTATLCWYRRYASDAAFTPQPLSHLSLELWTVDSDGALLECVRRSAPDLYNVAHLYYCPSDDESLAVLVHGESGDASVGYGVSCQVRAMPVDQDSLSADLNRDGIVNADDLILWTHLASDSIKGTMTVPGDSPADINCDGIVDRQDVYEISRQWNLRSAWYMPGVYRPDPADLLP